MIVVFIKISILSLLIKIIYTKQNVQLSMGNDWAYRSYQNSALINNHACLIFTAPVFIAELNL